MYSTILIMYTLTGDMETQSKVTITAKVESDDTSGKTITLSVK